VKGKFWTRRRLLGWGILGSGAAVLGNTFFIEPFWLELVERKLPIRFLPESLKGKTLVQISDIHIGHLVSNNFLLNSFQRVSELNPDIVVYTGDFISHGEEAKKNMEALLPHLPRGRMGTAAILGNHDYGENWAEEKWADLVIALLQTRDIPVLRNTTIEIEGLQILGLDDVWAHKFRLKEGLASLDPNRASIVLSHNPDTVDLGDWSSYQGWILSGHTHGGQCKPPFLPPPLLPVTNRRYTAGHFELSGGRDLYINRALGYVMQVRFNVRPEITIFELCDAPS